jgi:two-component system OmpR family sensor kinase
VTVVRRARLAVRIYLYTLFCVVLAVALFVLIAVALHPGPPHRRGPEPRPRPGIAAAGERRGPPPEPPRFERRPPAPEVPTRLFVITGVALLGVVLVASIAFARSLARPLQRLETVAAAFGRGEHDARTGLVRTDEIGAVADAFDDMAERTTQLMQSQRELMGNVSHELRTPLSRMRVALDLAAEGDAEMARTVVGEIERDVLELETLVDDILTSTRLDLVAHPLRLESVDPAEVVRWAEQRARAVGGRHPIRVTMPASLRRIRADPMLLRRVLDNLLDNARKYSDAGTPIDVRVSESGGTLVIEIEDRGIGIAVADLDRIFTPFFRADRSRNRGTGGVGLGLSLAQKIARAHGGTVRVRSVVGSGTVMRVELPVVAIPRPPTHPALV